MIKISGVMDFVRGVKLALSDDRRIGKNDVPALQALAKQTGIPGLSLVVDAFSHVPASFQAPAAARGHWVSEVVSFNPGPGGGYNGNHLDVVQGPPDLIPGKTSGSTQVVSLGRGGSITVKLEKPVTKGLVVHENAFEIDGKIANPSPANVEVSADGVKWYALKGQAGLKTDGDRFQFSKNNLPAGLSVQFVRITDATPAAGGSATGGVEGFDLNAVKGYN